MPMTNEELESVIEKIVTQKMNGINKQLKKLDEVCDKLVEIEKLLAGDDRYHIEGMKKRQDEMWRNHQWWRENEKDGRELIDNYRNWRWFFKNVDKWMGLIGIGTIVSIVVSLLNLFS